MKAGGTQLEATDLVSELCPKSLCSRTRAHFYRTHVSVLIEFLGGVGSTPDPYLGGLGFKIWSRDRLY